MGRRKDEDGQMRVSSEGGFVTRLRRALITVVLLLVILWLTVWLGVGTRGGHDLVVDRVGGAIGMELTCREVRFGFPAVFTLEEVETKGFGEGGGGLQVNQAAIALRAGRPWLRVTLRRPVLNLVFEPGRGWEPAAFSRLGYLPAKHIREVSQLCERIRHKLSVVVNSGSVTWTDRSRGELAAARGVDFKLSPARVPEHRMSYYFLRVYNVHGTRGERLDDVELEWLASDALTFIEIRRSASLAAWSGEGFWGTKAQ